MICKVVEFSAPYCGTCKMMSAMVRRVCEENAVELEVLDVEKNPEIVDEYNISSLPTFAKFENEMLVDMKTGSMTEEEFNEWIKY